MGQVLDLDDPRSASPHLAGAKAAWLARARQQGLSILPGVVVTAAASVPALKCGVDTLMLRGSGGARLEVGRFPLDRDLLAEVISASSRLGSALAVRSSSVMEGDGEWSGAFASYLEVARSEIAKAITGCWASAFSVNALERFKAVGLEPVSAPMAVLIQPVMRPDFGGVARLDRDGEVEIIGTEGSPASLVQGWVSGVRVVSRAGGDIDGTDEAVAYLGTDLVGHVASQLRAAHRLLGANTCEWGVADGHVSLLQLGIRTGTAPPALAPATMSDPRLVDLGRLARRYPGPLGEALVLAWGASDPVAVIDVATAPMRGTIEGALDPAAVFDLAIRESAALSADVWEMPAPMAAARAAAILRQVRGTHPGPALDCLTRLKTPDPARAARILRLLTMVQRAVEAKRPRSSASIWHQPLANLAKTLHSETRGDPQSRLAGNAVERVGTDRWEPFQTAVVASFGSEHRGVAASPGLGCGRLCFISGPEQADEFRPRDVVVMTHPVPNLAPLLWDAAGVVTIAGSPAAHLFESARSLNVPAVCSVDLDDSLGPNLADTTGKFALAVDGNRGLVYASGW
jgi:pyruvate phosphate dikinase-like enzyme/PEP-utilizing family enzyme